MTTDTLCKLWGVTRETIYKYRKLGMPCNKINKKQYSYILSKCIKWRKEYKNELRRNKSHVIVTYQGEKVLLSEKCAELGIDYKNAHTKFKKFGDNEEKIFSRVRMITLKNGEQVKLSEFSKMTGISIPILSRRYCKYGNNFDMLIRPSCKSLQYNGEYFTIKEISEMSGVSISTIYSRIKQIEKFNADCFKIGGMLCYV